MLIVEYLDIKNAAFEAVEEAKKGLLPWDKTQLNEMAVAISDYAEDDVEDVIKRELIESLIYYPIKVSLIVGVFVGIFLRIFRII